MTWLTPYRLISSEKTGKGKLETNHAPAGNYGHKNNDVLYVHVCNRHPWPAKRAVNWWCQARLTCFSSSTCWVDRAAPIPALAWYSRTCRLRSFAQCDCGLMMPSLVLLSSVPTVQSHHNRTYCYTWHANIITVLTRRINHYNFVQVLINTYSINVMLYDAQSINQS